MELRHGGRIELVLEESAPELVRYAALLETPDSRWEGEAEIRPNDGKIALISQPHPAWLVALVEALLRAELRSHKTDDRRPWPRRITRWRPAPT